jgi:hypothetical protein
MSDLIGGDRSAGGGPAGDLPEAADRRLTSGAFSSGLTVPDFAACLHMGLRPVGLVQGFCVMQWGWTGQGSIMRGTSPYSTAGRSGSYSEVFRCPHGYVSAEHRSFGQNFDQPWVEQAWAQGFGSAYGRLMEEAGEAGAHGVIGVVDTNRHLADLNVTEFHILGTAVVVEGWDPPPGTPIWTTSLAGQRLGKLLEAGLMPVSVVAAMSSVRVWASCMTEYLMSGQAVTWGQATGTDEVVQISKAHMEVRRLARDQVRGMLGGDSLHGARLDVFERGGEDQVIEAVLRGTRVRRFKDVDPIPVPKPTVSLA